MPVGCARGTGVPRLGEQTAAGPSCRAGGTGLVEVGCYLAFACTLVGVWPFASAMSEETGGKPLPMGGPLLGG